MLLADGIIRAAIASYSVILSPSLTVSRVDSLSVELFFLPSVSAVLSTSIIWPCSPFLMGWSRRMMYAVIDLVTLAIGTGFCSPDWPSVPRPAAAMYACPSVGHGSWGLAPSKVYEDFAVMTSFGSGSGRTSCTTARMTARSTTSGA